jgi:peroxiredoxin family protein
MIASRGTLDWAYPPFLLASGAVAMGWEVGIFFTFYGLPLLAKKFDALVTPVGNPAMPMRMPFGSEEFQKTDIPMPRFLMMMPGFDHLTTNLMKQTFKNKGVASVVELRDLCIEAGAQMIACQMTMDVFGYTKDDFIPQISVGGAGMFLDYAADADIQLFI